MAEITDVLERLVERTKENKISWKSTPDPQSFVAVIGNNSVMILEDNVGDIVLRVLNEAGEIIETLDTGIDSGDKLQGGMEELHVRARRMALGVDSQLDDLLKALES